MKIGAMNHPAKNVQEEIDFIASSGFDFIDFTYEWPSNRSLNSKEISKKLKDYNLEIVGHTAPNLPAIYPISTIRSACLDELKRSADFFVSIGADKMNIHPFHYNEIMKDREIIDLNIKLLDQVSNYCQSLDISLMLENFIAPFDNAEVFAEILLAVPKLEVHLDVGHLNLKDNFNAGLDSFLEIFSSKIVHCHIHDNDGEGDDHLPLGCGLIPWLSVAKKMKSCGYNGTFTLEVFCEDKDYLIISKDKWRKIWDKA